jgi:hypothetical protein
MNGMTKKPPVISSLVLGFLVTIVLAFMLIVFYPSTGSASFEANEHTTLAYPLQSTSSLDENVTLEIRFFELNSPIDADTMNISLGLEGQERFLDIDLIGMRQEEGVYQVEFSIFGSDVTPGTDSIPVTVRCGKESSRSLYEDSMELCLSVSSDIQVSIEPESLESTAGSDITFYVNTTKNDMPSTPESISAFVTINGNHQEVVLQSSGEGLFTYSYTDPDDGVGKEVELDIIVKEANVTTHHSAQAFVELLQLWFRVDLVTEHSIRSTLGVSTIDGLPLEATIEYETIFQDSIGTTISISGNGVTSPDGTLSLDFDVADIDPRSGKVELLVWTNVTGTGDGDISQFTRYCIPYHSFGPEPGKEFEVIFENDDRRVQPGQEVNLTFTAYHDSTGIQEQEILYFMYVTPPNEKNAGPFEWNSMFEPIFFGNGIASTDLNGRLSLSIIAPADPSQLIILFKTNTSEIRSGLGEWIEAQSEPIIIGVPYTLDAISSPEISDFGPHTSSSISVSLRDHADATGSLRVLPFTPPTTANEFAGIISGDRSTGWNRLGASSSYHLTGYSGSEIAAPFNLPSFLFNKTVFLIIADSVDHGSNGYPQVRGYVVVNSTCAVIDPLAIPLSVDVELPDSLEAGDMRSLIITLDGDGNLSGIHVTLESTSNLATCKSEATTDSTGVVKCLVQATVMTGENQTGTVWINATREGYAPVYYSKEIEIIIVVTLEKMLITTDLPDVVDSAETRPMAFYVTNNGVPVPGVRITIQAVGTADTCKEAGTTDENGEVHCTLFVFHVITKNSSVMLYLNGTKDGYEPYNYTKFILIKAENSPDELIDPISLELPNGFQVHVQASIVGNISIDMQETSSPMGSDPYSAGVYANIVSRGDGTLRWVNITWNYDSIPAGLDENKMRLFYWDTFTDAWKLAKDSGVNTENGYIYANVTRLAIFSPREMYDVDPPTISTPDIRRADPDADLTITTRITDEGSGVRIVTLYYRTPGMTVFNILTMVADGDEFSTTIPAHHVRLGETIEFYIRASDASANTATNPEDTDSPLTIEVKEKEEGSDLTIALFAGSALILILIGGGLFLYRSRKTSD